MTEPQDDDLILSAIAQITHIQTKLATINAEETPYMAERATNNAKSVETFQLEAN